MSTVPPILFIIFNRKDIALRTFEAIKIILPSVLFIACDGPRNSAEEKKVSETRSAILNAIDWDCEVKTLFQDKNLGCGMGVFTAINWFFDNVESGIILEDDCIAESTFFKYAAELLEKYKDDQRIGMIAGYNPINLKNYPYSYIFSRYKSCWGWATWRRAWKNMDLDMKWRNTKDYDSILANMGDRGADRSGWIFKLNAIDKKYVSAWDWQWFFTLSGQNQLCIYPIVNQISNIGNDRDATHTSLASITIPSRPLHWPLLPPRYFAPWIDFEKAFYRNSSTWRIKLIRLLPHRLKQKIKRLLAK